MSSRRWSRPDVLFLREHFGEMPVEVIAKALRRSPDSVEWAARKHGLTRRYAKVDQNYTEKVRVLHAEGWTDPEIAKKLKAGVATVTKVRKQLGLASNRGSARSRDRARQRMLDTCERKHITPSTYKQHAALAAASDEGFPGISSKSDLKLVLFLVAKKTPLTRKEIFEAVNVARSDHRGKDRLARLVRMGIVRKTCIGRFAYYDITVEARRNQKNLKRKREYYRFRSCTQRER